MRKTVTTILALIFVFVVILVAVKNINNHSEIEHTKELCRQWAAADHSGAVPAERLKWLKDTGVWDSFDWYASCMSESKLLRDLTRKEK